MRIKMNIANEGTCFTEYAIGQKVQLQSRRGTEHNDLEPTPLMQGGRTNMHSQAGVCTGVSVSGRFRLLGCARYS